ncbi:MAG: TRAP transporter permease, partial [Eubacterium sp.]|nr:TRAP transporter permease [Eubacterium sp.]
MSEFDRKEFEKRMADEENRHNREEEKKLDNYDSFVDQNDNTVHEDIETVMRKYDRESNTRVWVGKPKMAITIILAAFSVWCIYVTLFATFLEEIRLTSFMGLIILMGFLIYPAKKGVQKVNYMPVTDIIAMILGSGAFFYFTLNANQIINQGTRFA